MDIKGYKAFHVDMTNRYGKFFEEGKIYSIDSEPRFGVSGTGFHFCERLEDTLRYYPAMEEEIQIAQVTALGDFVKSEDTYYGYFDLFCTSKIRVDHILSHKEIIQMALQMPMHSAIRFIQGFRLSAEEIQLFRLIFENEDAVQRAISYYQEGNETAFSSIPSKCKLKSNFK